MCCGGQRQGSIEYEDGPSQAERLISDVRLEGANGVVTPGVKSLMHQIEADKLLPERGGYGLPRACGPRQLVVG